MWLCGITNGERSGPMLSAGPPDMSGRRDLELMTQGETIPPSLEDEETLRNEPNRDVQREEDDFQAWLGALRAAASSTTYQRSPRSRT